MKNECEFFVYILFSNKFDRFYVGMTNNIVRRLKQHNLLQVQSTKAFSPWVIIYQETFDNRIDARKREKYLKTAAGKRWRKQHLGM